MHHATTNNNKIGVADDHRAPLAASHTDCDCDLNPDLELFWQQGEQSPRIHDYQ